LRAAIVRARGAASRLGLSAMSSVVRPRFVRGAYLEHRVDARTIDTERLQLRPHDIADAEAWHRIVSNPHVIRHLSWPLRDPAAARRHLLDRTHHTVLWQADDFFALAVTLDGELIGDVSLHLRSIAHDIRTVEVGWLLDPGHEGHGYATEAVHAVLDIAFNEVEARIALAVIENGNSQSIDLARRIGFNEVHRDSANRLFEATATSVAKARRE
jgi:RimJ/RimL family protein N-acetyltransferase